MFVISILVVLVTVLCVKWIRDRKYRQSLFERLGVKGPAPSLIMGNFAEMLDKGYQPTLHQWTKKYGKLFGYYEGESPVLVVSDPDLVKQITIKQFHKFHAHKDSPFQQQDEESHNVFDAAGERWKRLRSISSSSFTARRMKEMSPLINKSVTDLIELFDKRCNEGKPFDIHSDFGRLTTDVISSCAFGLDSGCLRDENSKFLVEVKKVFEEFEKLPLRIRLFLPLMLVFPGLMKTLRFYLGSFDRMLSVQPWWFMSVAQKVLKERQSTKIEKHKQRVDFVQLMLDTNEEMGSGRHILHEEQEDNDSADSSSRSTKLHQNLKPLTVEEMQAQMAIFLVAGYETTSTALGFTAHDLAVNPLVQKKLQEEIDSAFPSKDIRPDYTTVHKLPYLEAVLKESLRLHPIAPIGTTRGCTEEAKLGHITVPAGTQVQINMDDLHFSPELWGQHDPNKFVPERFLEDCQDAQNNMAWIPFGAGPRMCLGMRFAQMEYKIALARVLKKFNIKRCDATKVPLPTKKNGVHGPSEGVYVVLERRV